MSTTSAVTSIKRLLIIAYHFPPSAAVGGLRLLGFTRHLPACGWEADVVAPRVCLFEQEDVKLLELIPSTTKSFHVPFPSNKVMRKALHLTGFSVWIPLALLTCRRLVRSGNYDAVLTSGPPNCVHIIGRHLKRHFGIPWVADFRDTWTGMLQGAFTTNVKNWGDRYVARQERQMIHEADAVIANTPGGAEAFKAEFPESASRISFVTNGYDPEDFVDDPLPASGACPGVIDVLHSGNIYAGRDPIPVMTAIAKLNAEADAKPDSNLPRFRIHFVGHVQEWDLSAEAERLGLNKETITIRDRVSHEQIVREMKGADILLLLDSPERRIGVPAKLYEYLGAGRPVLALSEPDNDVARIAKDSGLPSRIVPFSDIDAIGSALLELASTSVSDLKPSERFTRASLSRDLAEILDQIAPEKGRVSKTVGKKPQM